MHIALNTKDSKWALVLSLLILVVSTGCERNLRIKIDGTNPATLTLSGSGNLVSLYLAEVHDNKPLALEDPEIWRVRPNGNDKISELPSITLWSRPEWLHPSHSCIRRTSASDRRQGIRVWRPRL